MKSIDFVVINSGELPVDFKNTIKGNVTIGASTCDETPIVAILKFVIERTHKINIGKLYRNCRLIWIRKNITPRHGRLLNFYISLKCIDGVIKENEVKPAPSFGVGR